MARLLTVLHKALSRAAAERGWRLGFAWGFGDKAGIVPGWPPLSAQPAWSRPCSVASVGSVFWVPAAGSQPRLLDSILKVHLFDKKPLFFEGGF